MVYFITFCVLIKSWAGKSKSVLRLASRWAVEGSNPGEGKMFRTRPHQPWRLPSLLYNGYQVSLSRVKQMGRKVDHPPPTIPEVKENVQLHLYSPSGASWSFLGWNVTFSRREDERRRENIGMWGGGNENKEYLRKYAIMNSISCSVKRE